MPPLTPTSSQEIVCISPPPPSQKRRCASRSPPPAAKPEASTTNAAASAKRRKAAVNAPDGRSRTTERMLSSLKSTRNPITHSDAFSRTQHVHSCSTGHQQRGGDRGFWTQARDANVKADAGPEHTYWSVRTANVEAAAREKTANILTGCVIAVNGPTGPKVSNLQLQNLITTNGGRLSGTKAQKHINGQGSRGAATRTQVVKVEWVLDSVSKGRRLNEAAYVVVEDPTQQNIFSAFGGARPSEAGSSKTA